MFKIRRDRPNRLRRTFGKYYLLVRILLGMRIIGVPLLGYIAHLRAIG